MQQVANGPPTHYAKYKLAIFIMTRSNLKIRFPKTITTLIMSAIILSFKHFMLKATAYFKTIRDTTTAKQMLIHIVYWTLKLRGGYLE